MTVTEIDPLSEPFVLLTLIQLAFSLTVHSTLDVTEIDCEAPSASKLESDDAVNIGSTCTFSSVNSNQFIFHPVPVANNLIDCSPSDKKTVVETVSHACQSPVAGLEILPISLFPDKIAKLIPSVNDATLKLIV